MSENPEEQPPLFYLFSDFGPGSVYVGQMTAVIQSIVPGARIHSLSDTVPRQSPVAAAFLLRASLSYLPDDVYLPCVVDPGVGSDRAILALQVDSPKCTLVGPDNGMFGFLRDRVMACRKVENRSLWLEPVSNTFHGRDIMAPTLAHIARGTPLEEVGPEHEEIQSLPEEGILEAEWKGDVIEGRILFSDRFGNLITNIHTSQLEELAQRDIHTDLYIETPRMRLDSISTSYNEVDHGSPLALVGSSGYLELAINKGSAEASLRLEPGQSIHVHKDS